MKNVIAMILWICLASCRKTNEDPIPCSDKDYGVQNSCSENKSYYPLTKGSYWIYECSNYFVDTDTRLVYRYDSCYITNQDTIINGLRYAVRAWFNYQASPAKNYCRYDENYVIVWPNYKLFPQ